MQIPVILVIKGMSSERRVGGVVTLLLLSPMSLDSQVSYGAGIRQECDQCSLLNKCPTRPVGNYLSGQLMSQRPRNWDHFVKPHGSDLLLSSCKSTLIPAGHSVLG